MCNYVFDPSQCINVVSIREDTWNCPREPLENSHQCEYHADASDLVEQDLTETEIFIQLLSEDEKIFGANFQSVQISKEHIRDISLNSSEIYNAEFEYFEIKNADLEFSLSFQGCEFGNYHEYETINRRPRGFFGCNFRQTFSFSPETNFETLRINSCRFSANVQIDGEYRDRLSISRSYFNNTVKINDSEFKNGLKLSDCKFRGEIHIADITVQDEALIDSVELPLKTILSKSSIEEIKLRPEMGLPSLVDVRSGTELSKGSLMNTAEGDVYYDLSHATIGDIDLDLINADWTNYLFKSTKFTEFRFVDYEDRIIKNNYELHSFAYSRDLFFESRVFPDGMFSRCDISPNSLNIETGVFPSEMMFRMCEPLRTSNARNVNKVSGMQEDFADNETWFPDDLFLEGGEQSDDRVLPSKDYEEQIALRNHTETYMRAKNHAQSNGIGNLASGFHVLQKRAERAKYKSRSRSTSSIREKCSNRFRSFQNGVLRWLYNYGEGTYYPLIWSGVFIAVAAFMYIRLGVVGEETTTSTIFGMEVTHHPVDTWAEGVQYSTRVFTTLGSSSISTDTLREGAIVSVQSALGTIMIALFVFTLGRRATR